MHLERRVALLDVELHRRRRALGKLHALREAGEAERREAEAERVEEGVAEEAERALGLQGLGIGGDVATLA